MGALCSRGATESRATASAKAPGLTGASNNNGQSPHPASTDNHSTDPAFATALPVGPAPVVLDGMRSAAEPGGPVPQAAYKQVLALEQQNRALQSELSQAKATWAQQLQEQQQRETELKAQVAEAQRRVEEHASAREGLERTVAELRLKCESLNSLNQQLKRRVSHVVTGHSEERDMHAAQADVGQQSRALVVLRDGNAESQLPLLWTAADSKRWQGVRMEGGDVTGLALSSMMIHFVPTEIGKLTSLTALLLSNNHIKRLPPAIKNLKALTYLLLDGNELVDLPEEIAEVSQLQTLWLHDNKLIGLPGSIGRLRELRQLLLSNNALMSLPETVGELTKLSSLWLDNNRLEVLPQSIRKLTTMHRLRVDSHLLPQLPPEILRLTQDSATSVNVAAESPKADGSTAGGSGSGVDASAVAES